MIRPAVVPEPQVTGILTDLADVRRYLMQYYSDQRDDDYYTQLTHSAESRVQEILSCPLPDSWIGYGYRTFDTSFNLTPFRGFTEPPTGSTLEVGYVDDSGASVMLNFADLGAQIFNKFPFMVLHITDPDITDLSEEHPAPVSISIRASTANLSIPDEVVTLAVCQEALRLHRIRIGSEEPTPSTLRLLQAYRWN